MKAWLLNRTSVDRFFDRYFVQVTVLPIFLMMVCVFGLPLVFSFYLSFTAGAWTSRYSRADLSA